MLVSPRSSAGATTAARSPACCASPALLRRNRASSASRRGVLLSGSGVFLLPFTFGDEALAAESSKSKRGLARYIRRKDTTSIDQYRSDVVEAKTQVGGLVELVKNDDYESGRKLLREGTFKTFRNSVRAIVTFRDLNKAPPVPIQDVFQPLETIDSLLLANYLLSEKEDEASKGELEETRAKIFDAIDTFQQVTQNLIEI
mmetsp:Transcript_4782/g.16742  ORF Transcript_4782/g.16742 Transcript_4782/m.16742 type:complete len:201 (-) Transcript_4782:860-1462(-)